MSANQEFLQNLREFYVDCVVKTEPRLTAEFTERETASDKLRFNEQR
jgi:hypothetical protein